uniref:Large ribosomal subunit protein uL23m n=1 Tax=Strigops habroptila TaxID=2489341 RepID=A0A672TS42_STRHB
PRRFRPSLGHGKDRRQEGRVPAVPAGRPAASDLPAQLLHAGGAARRAAARGHRPVPRLHGVSAGTGHRTALGLPRKGPSAAPGVQRNAYPPRSATRPGTPPLGLQLVLLAERMTRIDVKNYLEKIYNVPVAAVRTRIQYGANNKRNHKNQRVKKPDYKVAYVQLGQGQTFQFPNLFPEKEDDAETRSRDDFRNKYMEREKKRQEGDLRRGGVPDWFGL